MTVKVTEHKIFLQRKGGGGRLFKPAFLPGVCKGEAQSGEGCCIHLHAPSISCTPSAQAPHISPGIIQGVSFVPAQLHASLALGGNCVSAHRVAEKNQTKQLMDSGWACCPGSITQPGPAELGGFAEHASGLRKGM